MEKKYLDGKADLTAPKQKRYRILLSQYIGNSSSCVRDEILADIDNRVDDFDTIGQARAYIFEMWDELCKIAVKWWVDVDGFDLDDELWLDIYEITTNDDGDDDYECVDGYCMYENYKWNDDVDKVFDFSKIYDNLNLYQKNTLLALSFYGGYEIVDDFGLLNELYFDEYKTDYGVCWADLMNIQDLDTALDFWDTFIYYDKDNWFLNADSVNTDLDYELAKDYRLVVNDCCNELINSCKEQREFNNNKQIKNQFDDVI